MATTVKTLAMIDTFGTGTVLLQLVTGCRPPCKEFMERLKEGGTITSEMSVLGGVRFTMKGLG